MTPESINIAIAEELGWTGIYHQDDGMVCGITPPDYRGVKWDSKVPSFFGDLNACAQMRKALTPIERETFARHLYDRRPNCDGIIGFEDGVAVTLWRNIFSLVDAPPDEQAITFLRVKGKWVEEKGACDE